MDMRKIKQNCTILAIDTSCDETAAAVTVGRRVLSNVIWSQIEIHRPWGGVVPDLARKEHQKHLDQVIELAIKRANTTSKRFRLPWKISWKTIDALAVTQGPGLAIALEVGIRKTKELAQKYNKPVIAVNHMEGHLLSSFALNAKGNGPFAKTKVHLPLLGLLVSGGHTQLVLMENFGQYKLLGETLDDAAGEAFDKVAKMLELGYPGGPIISELARKGNPKRFSLPIPMARNQTLNFSFSGLKTACLYKLKTIPLRQRNKKFLQDFSASFERVLIKSITLKLRLAIEKHRPRQILLGGGVVNNLRLRREARKTARKYGLSVAFPYSKNLISDNAAMIGIAAFWQARNHHFVTNLNQLDRQPNLNFPR